MKSFATLLLISSVDAIRTKGFYDSTVFAVQVNSGNTDGKKCLGGQVATVQYTGKLMSDKSVFDSTTKKGPFSFVLGQAEVIECWDQAFTKIPIGEKASVDCPASMAYGAVTKPGIPEDSDL